MRRYIRLPFSRTTLALMLGLFILIACTKHTKNSAPSTPSTSYCSDSFTGTKQYGYTAENVYGFGSAVDSDCNYFVGGHTTAPLDGNSVVGFLDLFITKYDSAGNKVWTKLLGSAGQTIFSYAIASDSEGNVYATGYTTGPVDDQTMIGNQDLLVVKYDKSGSRKWSRISGAAISDTFGYGITTDAANNVYVTGQTWGNLDGNTKLGAIDSFLIKYDTNGTKLWTRTLGVSGGTASTESEGIAVGASGAIYLSGSVTEALPGNTLTGTLDAYVAKYSSEGARVWLKQFGDTGNATNAKGLAVDSSETIFVTGVTTGNLSGTLTGTQDMFVTKYDSSGTRDWTRQLGVSGGGILMDYNATATDRAGNVYVGGHTDRGLDGNTQIGNLDVFVTKYDSTGTKKWTLQNGGVGGNSRVMSLAINEAQSLFLAGQTDGSFPGHSLTGSSDGFILPYLSTTGQLK